MATQSREERPSSGPDSRFADALRPLVESALKGSVRDEPEFWAQAMFPILTPAIRMAVATAIRDMVLTLNQLLENGLSARSWRWRFEAWRTGKPLAEVVMLRTLVYRVEQVLLVDRNSGLLLASVSAPGISAKHSDLVSSMLTAIQAFIHDSFQLEEHDSIRQIHTGDFSLWVEPGPVAALAAAVRGNAPTEFRHTLRAAIDLIHEEMGTELRDFQGESKSLEQRARPILEGCLQSQFQKRGPSSFWRLWLCACIFGAALLLWGALGVWHAMQWHRALAALETTPGITITGSSLEHGKHVLEGLRDPFALPPENVLAKNGIPISNITLRFQPFLSLDPTLLIQRARAAIDAPDSVSVVIEKHGLKLWGTASHQWIISARNAGPKLALAGIEQVRTDTVEDRELEALRSQIEKVRIAFRSGSSTIEPGQARLIEAVVPKLREWAADALAIGRVPRVKVVGHADLTGSSATNSNLSNERARHVEALLLAGGIRPDSLEAIGEAYGAGKQPAAPVDSRSLRNVVFRLSYDQAAEGERP
jgi:outer membrane protein OmpA-like peptidoglycan-associated protein